MYNPCRFRPCQFFLAFVQLSQGHQRGGAVDVVLAQQPLAHDQGFLQQGTGLVVLAALEMEPGHI